MLLNVNGPFESVTSSITTLRAYDGPPLSTKTVQVIGVPAYTVVSGLQILVTCRSAESLTTAVSDALLFDESGSMTAALVTVALSVMLVAPPVPTTVSGWTNVTM